MTLGCEASMILGYKGEVVMVLLIWFWYDFGSFWVQFWAVLRSCWGQKSAYRLHGRSIRLRPGSRQFDFAHFGRFWETFGEDFGDIFVSFVDIDFIIKVSMILKWFLMDFDTLWTSKSEQKAWRVVQKSTLHVVCYRMGMDIDFGRILGSGWEQFHVPIAFQKRLRKQVL